MNMIEKFATRDVAPAQRLNFWNELVGQTYAGTFINAPTAAFDAEMLRWKIGDLDMIRPRSEPSTVGRNPVPGGGGDRVVLHLQCRGQSRHRQERREAQLSPGDFVLSSAADGYTIDLASHELLVVEFPRAALAARVTDLDDRLMTRICGASPGGRIFHDYLLSLWRHGALNGPDDGWQDGVAEAFYDLAALAVRGSDAVKSAGPGIASRSRLEAIVQSRLGDPELRTGSIADAMRVSPRTVQNLFAAMGTTPSLYVLEQRLKRAGDILLANPGANITALAFELGFNDSAYFTRCFRRQFGTTPSAWRARH